MGAIIIPPTKNPKKDMTVNALPDNYVTDIDVVAVAKTNPANKSTSITDYYSKSENIFVSRTNYDDGQLLSAQKIAPNGKGSYSGKGLGGYYGIRISLNTEAGLKSIQGTPIQYSGKVVNVIRDFSFDLPKLISLSFGSFSIDNGYENFEPQYNVPKNLGEIELSEVIASWKYRYTLSGATSIYTSKTYYAIVRFADIAFTISKKQLKQFFGELYTYPFFIKCGYTTRRIFYEEISTYADPNFFEREFVSPFIPAYATSPMNENIEEGIFEESNISSSIRFKFCSSYQDYKLEISKIKSAAQNTSHEFGNINFANGVVPDERSADFPSVFMYRIANEGLLFIDDTDPDYLTYHIFSPYSIYNSPEVYSSYSTGTSDLALPSNLVVLDYYTLKIYNAYDEEYDIEQYFSFKNTYLGKKLQQKLTFTTPFNYATDINNNREIISFLGEDNYKEILTDYKYGKRTYRCTIPYGDYRTTDSISSDPNTWSKENGDKIGYIPNVGDRHIPLGLDLKPLSYNRDMTPCQFELTKIEARQNAQGGFEGFYCEGIEVTKVI